MADIAPKPSNKLVQLAAAQAGMAPPAAGQQPAAVPPPSNALKYKVAFGNDFVGNRDSIAAMFPDQFGISEQEKPGVIERGLRGIGFGLAQMIPSSMTVLGGILDRIDENTQNTVGQGLAEAGMMMQEWLDKNVAVENPTMYDHIANGVGSAASFLIPGLGAASVAGKVTTAANLTGRMATVISRLTGLSIMSVLESSVEQSQRQQELMKQGMGAGDALAASSEVFWNNMWWTMATNAPLWSPGRRLARAVVEAMSEGIQERGQSVIQDVAAGRGTWSDFFEDKYWTETIVGAVIGGGMGLVMPGDPGGTEKGKSKLPPKPPRFTATIPPQRPATQPTPFAPPPPGAGTAPAAGPSMAPPAPAAPGAASVPQGQVDAAQAVMELERGLRDEYGVDVDIQARLTPDQFNELAGLAMDAYTEQDPATQWAKAEIAYQRAKDFLFRGAPTARQTDADNRASARQQRQQQILDYEANRTARRSEYEALRDLPPGMIPPPSEGLRRQVGRQVPTRDDYVANRTAAATERQALQGMPPELLDVYIKDPAEVAKERQYLANKEAARQRYWDEKRGGKVPPAARTAPQAPQEPAPIAPQEPVQAPQRPTRDDLMTRQLPFDDVAEAYERGDIGILDVVRQRNMGRRKPAEIEVFDDFMDFESPSVPGNGADTWALRWMSDGQIEEWIDQAGGYENVSDQIDLAVDVGILTPERRDKARRFGAELENSRQKLEAEKKAKDEKKAARRAEREQPDAAATTERGGSIGTVEVAKNGDRKYYIDGKLARTSRRQYVAAVVDESGDTTFHGRRDLAEKEATTVHPKYGPKRPGARIIDFSEAETATQTAEDSAAETDDQRYERIRNTRPNDRSDEDIKWANEYSRTKRAEAEASPDGGVFPVPLAESPDGYAAIRGGGNQSSREWAVKTLKREQRFNGKPMPRHEFIEDAVDSGYTVGEREGQEALISPDGKSWFLKKDITSTAIDYARYLISLKRDSKQRSATQTAAPPDPAEPTVFFSGLSRSPSDMRGVIDAGKPVGVSLYSDNPNSPALSDTVINRLVNAARSGIKVFIDSGSFTAFAKKKPYTEADWDRVVRDWRRILDQLSDQHIGNVYVVAPDVIGDHAATLEVQSYMIEQVQDLIDRGANVIVPVQKSADGTLSTNVADASDSFGEFEKLIIGIPFNAEAWSLEDVVEFVGQQLHDRIHLLGIGPKRLGPVMEAISEADPEVTVSADATQLRARIGTGRALTQLSQARRDARELEEGRPLTRPERGEARGDAVTEALGGPDDKVQLERQINEFIDANDWELETYHAEQLVEEVLDLAEKAGDGWARVPSDITEEALEVLEESDIFQTTSAPGYIHYARKGTRPMGENDLITGKKKVKLPKSDTDPTNPLYKAFVDATGGGDNAAFAAWGQRIMMDWRVLQGMEPKGPIPMDRMSEFLDWANRAGARDRAKAERQKSDRKLAEQTARVERERAQDELAKGAVTDRKIIVTKGARGGSRFELPYSSSDRVANAHVQMLAARGIKATASGTTIIARAEPAAVARALRETGYIGKGENVVVEGERAKKAPAPPAEVVEKAKVPAPKSSGSFMGVLYLDEISTDENRFQTRDFSQDFVDNAIAKFDENAVRPIEVWQDPRDKKFYVIDGHHTLAILKGVGWERRADVKFFMGTEAEAVERSRVANDQRRQNNDISRASHLRSMRERGDSEAAIEQEAKTLYDANWRTIMALSRLNPNGQVIQTLKDMMKAGDVATADLKKIAKWIGDARAKFPNLTNAHEQEMFDFLRDNLGKKGYTNEADFLATIANLVRDGQMFDAFDYSKSLNMKGLLEKNNVQREYDAQVAAAEKEVADAKRALDRRRKELISDNTPQDLMTQMLKKYEDRLRIATRELMELEERSGDVTREGGGEQTLFNMLPAERESLRAARRNFAGRMTNIKIVKRPDTPEFRLAEDLAKRFGLRVHWVSAVPLEPGGRMFGGWFSTGSNAIFINVKAASRSPIMNIMMHELTHYMEFNHSDLWRNIVNLAHKTLPPESLARFNAEMTARGYKASELAGELAAEIVGQAAQRETFWRTLRNENPSAFSILVDKVMDMINAVKVLLATARASYGFGPDQGDLWAQMKDTRAMEKAVANVMSEVQQKVSGRAAQEAADAVGQRTLFSIIPSAEAQQVMDSRKDMEGKLADLRKRRGWDIFRYIYQKMVDRNTWLFKAVKVALTARGINLRDYAMSKRPDLVLQTMGAWTEIAEMNMKIAVRSWDGKRILSDGLEPIIGKFGLADSVDDGMFGTFLEAARMVAMYDVRGDAFFGNDPTSAEYQAAEAEYRRYETIYNQYKGTTTGPAGSWAQAAKAITKWSNAIMTRLRESGAISKKQYDGLVGKYDIYAPLFVLDQENLLGQKSAGRTRPTAGRATWEMDRLHVVKNEDGSYSSMVRMDPMDGLVKNAYRIEFLAANNHAKLSAINFIKEMAGGVEKLKGFGERVKPKMVPIVKTVDQLLEAAGYSAKERQALGLERLADNDPQAYDDLMDILIDPATTKSEARQARRDAAALELQVMANLWVTSTYQENNTVGVLVDGEIQYWKLEPDIYDVYASINDKSSHDLMKFFTAQTRMLRAGAVLTPEFMGRNQFRDFMAAGVISRSMVKGPRDAMLLIPRVLRGLNHAIRKDEVWQEFIMDRAGHANLVALDQENLRRQVGDLTRGARGVKGRAAQAARNPVKYILRSHPIHVLQELSKLTENSTRLAVYEKTKTELLAAGVPEAEARMRAAIEAREASTDFGRAGEYGRVINRIIPFFNASIQGNDKLIRALFRDEGYRGATWARGVAMITLPSLLLWAINRDEEWYKEQPAWLKNHFWLFSVDGGKNIIKLPKPFDVGLIFASLPERFLDWMLEKDHDAVSQWADAYRKSVMTLDAGSIAGPMITSLVEIRSNHDAYRDTPIVKGWLNELEARQQYTSRTTEFSKWWAETFPGAPLGLNSPLMVDHFIRGSFGGIGQWGADIASNIIMMADPARKADKPSKKLIYNTIPESFVVARAFVVAGPTAYTQQMDDLYELYDSSREAVNSLRALKSGGGSKQRFLSLYRRRGVDLALNESVSRAVQQIGAMTRQIRVVESAPADVLSPDDKRKTIDRLMDARNEMAFRYMQEFDKIDRKAIQKTVEQSVDRIGRDFDASRR